MVKENTGKLAIETIVYGIMPASPCLGTARLFSDNLDEKVKGIGGEEATWFCNPANPWTR